MKKIICTFFICCIGMISNSHAYSPKIHSDLQNKMNQNTDNTLIPIYILLNDHMNLNDFSDISYDTPKQERRKIVIDRLKNFANDYQRNIKEYLELKKSERAIEKFEILWMANTIITSATNEIINELTAFDNIKMICYDAEYPSEELLDYKQLSAPFIGAMTKINSSSAPQIGIVLMKADQVWALGNNGSGVLVANSDDGFWWKHPDLVKGLWQNLGEDANSDNKTVNIQAGTTGSVFDPSDINGIDDDGNGKIDDLIGWDFTTGNYNITTASHGSATLGQVVGDGTMGIQTGVAPGAKCIVLRNSSGQSQQWLAFQYAVEMGAEVITSSLSWKWYMNPKPDYSQFRLITDMSLAAGVIHTNSTSNDGGSSSAPVPVNISAAGLCPSPWLHPDQLRRGNVSGVIGVGNVAAGTDLIHSTSPSGPSTWGNWSLWGTYTYPISPDHMDYPYSRVTPVEVPDSMGLLKPDVSAPGAGTASTYVSSGTGYGSSFGGTSSATPHTAGCVALMLSVNPEMLPADISKVIELTSVEKGAPGKDPRYGTGRIDALAATTSPKFTVEGVNGGGNMFLNNSITANDTARELAGIKISTNVLPQVGSLKTLTFGLTTIANTTHILSFDLYWDRDRNNVINTGDQKLRSVPFSNAVITFDSLKFKFLDTARNIILAARTSSVAAGQSIDLIISDTNSVTAYYTTKPFQTNFPLANLTGISSNVISDLSYALLQNYPNPFNPITTINYTVAGDGDVNLKVYNMIGKEVAVLVKGFKMKGNYSVEFDLNDNGSALSSGVYYYKMEAGNFSDIKKMILLK